MAMVKVTIKNVDSAIVLVHICASQTPLVSIQGAACEIFLLYTLSNNADLANFH